MAIPATTLNDLQNDTGIGIDESVFSDAELDRIWTRVAGAANDAQRYDAALGLIYRQLLANAVKLADYTQNASQEKRSQIPKNLKMMYDLYRPALDAALGRSKQMARATLKPRKHQERTRPRPDANSIEHMDDSL